MSVRNFSFSNILCNMCVGFHILNLYGETDAIKSVIYLKVLYITVKSIINKFNGLALNNYTKFPVNIFPLTL